MRDDVTLVADVGGTNVRFALATGGPVLGAVRAMRADGYAGLADAAAAYLAAAAPGCRPAHAVFAVASPVTGDAIEFTNRHWSFSIEALRRALDLDRLVVVNDFAALALALPHLSGADLDPLGGGATVADAPCVVLGPGTGLGVAALLPIDGRWLPVAGEGGHATMAAGDAAEAAVLERLRARFGHVSAERVLSGPGLANLWSALAEAEGRAAERPTPETITARARDGSCPVAVAAVRMFCGMLGAVAGDLALTFGARGGVYVAGGVVPALGPLFDRDAFRRRFEAKGRFAAYLAPVPAWLVRREQPALVGLAALAAVASDEPVPGSRVATR